jgi:hypothetical protein
MGVPMVFLSKTPERISIRSLSFRGLDPIGWPGRLLSVSLSEHILQKVQSGGTAINHHPQGFSMGFTPSCYSMRMGQIFADKKIWNP